MLKKSLWLLIGIYGSAALAQDTYRLAYSKNDDIEIFVDQATAETWCKDTLHLRVVNGASATPAGFVNLLPKLGGLFNQQCPQVTSLTWQHMTAQGALIAEGESHAASGWTYQIAQAEAPVSTTAQNEVSPAAEVEVEVEAEVGEEAVAEAEVVTDVETTADTATETPTPTAPVPAVVAEVAPPADTATEPPTAPTPAPAVVAAYTPLSAFNVGAWTPPTPEQRQELMGALKTRKNQDGCQLISHFDFGVQDEFIQVQTSDVSCDENGYLHGAGSVQLIRSDGAVIMRPTNIWFNHGLPFSAPVKQIHPDALVKVNQNHYWFSLGSDESMQSHYLLPARLQNHRGLGVWQPTSEMHVLTADSASFKQAQAINTQVETALARFAPLMADDTRSFSLLFADDLEQGLVQRTYDGSLYEIRIERNLPYRAAPGPWRYNLQQAKNHLFEREQRIAAQQQRDEERRQRELAQQQQRQAREQALALRQQARVESQRLELYEQLQEMDLSDPKNLHSFLYTNIPYQLDRTQVYENLLAGRTQPFSMIVEISGKKDQAALIDWPYEMRLQAQADLPKGWYWVKGQQSLDSTTLDKKGLPITTLTADAADIYSCQEKACRDLQDPLLIVRQLHGVPDWDPAQAKKLIEDAAATSPF